MDVLRAALGESQLIYFGASYGTKLGATYADLFPDKVGRLVLDGAVDLSIDSRQLSLEQAGGFEIALRSYVQNCVDDGDCFLGDTVDDGLATIQDLIAGVDEEPLPTQLERPLEVGNAFYGLVAPLYNREYWTILDQALEMALDDGNGTLLLRLSDVYESRNDDGTYSDNSAEAILRDQLPRRPLLDHRRRGARPDPGVRGGVTDVRRRVRLGAGGLPRRPGDRPPRSRRRDRRGQARRRSWSSARPATRRRRTSGPCTSPTSCESGVLVSRDGDGHTGYNSGNDCVDEAVEGYLIDGTVPAGRAGVLTATLERLGDRLDPFGGELDHQLRGGGEGGPAAVHDREHVVQPGSQRDPRRPSGPAGGAAARPRLAGSPSRPAPCRPARRRSRRPRPRSG